MNLPRLARRRFLGGAGTLLALPWLSSLLPKAAWAQGPTVKRFVAFYVPNRWRPGHRPKSAATMRSPPILEPLKAVKNKVLVLSGLANAPARPDGPGDHAAGTAGFLTCRHVVKTDGGDIRNGPSVDQVNRSRVRCTDTNRFTAVRNRRWIGRRQLRLRLQLRLHPKPFSWHRRANLCPRSPTRKPRLPRCSTVRIASCRRASEKGVSATDRACSITCRVKRTGLSRALATADRHKLDEYLTGVRRARASRAERSAGVRGTAPSQQRACPIQSTCD